jgi:CYTH domain-containing protein
VPVEIERVFLLRGLPEPMPAGQVWRIEQGYLPPAADEVGVLEGRLRRIVHADGTIEHVHTVKTGLGMVRQEVERTLDAAAFEREWPRTAGRRLEKVRTRIAQGDRTWEIDRFLSLPVVLAECELPSPDADLPIPAWLAPWIEREVTHEPAFRNSELARRAGMLPGDTMFPLP